MREAKKLEDIIKELPEDLIKEVEDFALFLLEKRKREETEKKKPTLSWAGGLSEFKDKYTSVELQHKALEWMAEDVFDRH
jgi:Uncharacterized conserved small protein